MKYLKYLALIAVLLMAGCDVPKLQGPNQDIRERIFFQCLAAIPKGPEQTKCNDWQEVVEECGQQAYYMSFDRKTQP